MQLSSQTLPHNSPTDRCNVLHRFLLQESGPIFSNIGASGLLWTALRGTHTVWAAPLALRGLFHVRVQADHVISSGTGVTQNDLSSLLAHLAVVLVVCLVAIAVLRFHLERTPSEN